MIERAIHALKWSEQVSEFTPLTPECNHKMDVTSLGLLGFTETQTNSLFAKFGNGKKEFHFTSMASMPSSELCEVIGEKFSSRVLSWVLIEKLIVLHNLGCLENQHEYLALDGDPEILDELSVEQLGIEVQLERLQLSTRTYNGLLRGGIKSLSALLMTGPEELSDIRNFGQKSLEEVRLVQEKFGGQLSDMTAATPEELSVERLGTDVQLEGLQLSTRTYNGLVRGGIRSLSALLVTGPEELSDIRNFGQKSLEEVLLVQEKYRGQLSDITAAAPSEINDTEEDLAWAWNELRAELEGVVRESEGLEGVVFNQFSIYGFDYNIRPMLARYLQSGTTTLGDFLTNLTSEVSLEKTPFELPSSVNFVSKIGLTLTKYKSWQSESLVPKFEKRAIIEFEKRYSNDEIDLLLLDSATLNLLNIHSNEKLAFLGRQTLFDLTDVLSTHFITHVEPWEVVRSVREFFTRYETLPSVIGLIIGIGKSEGEKKDHLVALLEDYFAATRPDSAERDMLIVQMRINGETLDSIGKAVGVSRARVWQIIKKISPAVETTLDYIHHEKELFDDGKALLDDQARETKLSALFSEFGAVYLAELAHCLATDERQVLAVTPKRFHKFVIDKTTPAVHSSLWTKDDVISLIQKAGTYYFPLRQADYEYLLEIGEIKGPSVQRIYQRFGLWSELCIEAGVEPAPSLKVDYALLWSEEELISFSERFFLDESTTGSANGFDEWRTRQTDQVPSGPHMRNQFGTWLEVRRVTLESIRTKKGKAIRS
jgi:hypothetical protein